MSYNMRYENTITHVLKVNDETTTALLRGEDIEDEEAEEWFDALYNGCLLYTSPSPRDRG